MRPSCSWASTTHRRRRFQFCPRLSLTHRVDPEHEVTNEPFSAIAGKIFAMPLHHNSNRYWPPAAHRALCIIVAYDRCRKRCISSFSQNLQASRMYPAAFKSHEGLCDLEFYSRKTAPVCATLFAV